MQFTQISLLFTNTFLGMFLGRRVICIQDFNFSFDFIHVFCYERELFWNYDIFINFKDA